MKKLILFLLCLTILTTSAKPSKYRLADTLENTVAISATALYYYAVDQIARQSAHSYAKVISGSLGLLATGIISYKAYLEESKEQEKYYQNPTNKPYAHNTIAAATCAYILIPSIICLYHGLNNLQA